MENSKKKFLMDFPSISLEIVMGTLETYSLVISSEIARENSKKNFLMDFPSISLEIVMGTLETYSLVISSEIARENSKKNFTHTKHILQRARRNTYCSVPGETHTAACPAKHILQRARTKHILQRARQAQ